MPAPKKITNLDKVTDIIKLKAKANVDNDLLAALIDPEGGFMRPGAMPKVTASSATGCKQLLDAVSKAICALGVGNQTRSFHKAAVG